MTVPLLPIVLALGATQIIGYGTLYYAYPILAHAIAQEFGASASTLFAILSIGLLLGGLAAPRLGRAMDVHGAPRLMAIGSGIVALMVAALALAQNIVVFGIVFIVVEVASITVLYDAAFACLALFGGLRARRAITYLTLIAGFASTLFWPLTGWLLELLGWRAVYGIFALLHLLLALPLHALLATRARQAKASHTFHAQGDGERAGSSALPAKEARIAFWAVAASFALSGMLTSALGVHLVPILQTIGLGPAAFMASMLMGPAQVLIRLTDALFWRNLHPLSVAAIACTALPLSVLVLMSGPSVLVTGAAFAIIFGIGQGLESIVRGSVPLVLFGREGYAERLGRLSAARIGFSASAPLLFAVAQDKLGLNVALGLLLAIGALAIVPLLVLRQHLAANGRLHRLPA